MLHLLMNATRHWMPDQSYKVQIKGLATAGPFHIRQVPQHIAHFIAKCELKGDGDTAYPEFVLTYLEELNEREEVTQTENRIHHGAWSAAHQEIDSSSEEVTVLSQRQVLQKKNVSNPNQKQLSGPLDACLMPADPLGETPQLTVALVRKPEGKHPKASAQRCDSANEPKEISPDCVNSSLFVMKRQQSASVICQTPTMALLPGADVFKRILLDVLS